MVVFSEALSSVAVRWIRWVCCVGYWHLSLRGLFGSCRSSSVPSSFMALRRRRHSGSRASSGRGNRAAVHCASSIRSRPPPPSPQLSLSMKQPIVFSKIFFFFFFFFFLHFSLFTSLQQFRCCQHKPQGPLRSSSPWPWPDMWKKDEFIFFLKISIPMRLTRRVCAIQHVLFSIRFDGYVLCDWVRWVISL